jgi:polynucleotide 5'-hydroxyl-kinase GRC3/NOL9
MAPKRRAQDAFGAPLSAFAAARLRQSAVQSLSPAEQPEALINSVAKASYDGHHTAFPSSDEDDEDAEAEIAVAAPSLSRLSSIRASSVAYGDDSLTIKLGLDENVTCVGIYDLTVTKGLVTVCGATLAVNSGSHRIYAPSTHALPQIVARRDGTVVHLSHVDCKLSKLHKLSSLFKNIWTKPHGKMSFAILYNTGDDELQRSLSAVELDKTTQQLLARLATEAQENRHSQRIMAIGAKSSGKSTLNRIICNTLTTKPSSPKVLYLDLDPGQPEFTAPGQISLVEVTAPLLGPPFTHLASAQSTKTKLMKCHTIATTSFKDNPDHYLACAKDLIRHAKPSQPLIVNSCGWLGGVGATILLELAKAARLTDLIVLDPVENELVEDLRSAVPASTIHHLPRQPARSSFRTPAELRNMQTMAYFHQRLPDTKDFPRWSSKAISSVRPWLVRYDSEMSGIFAITSYGQAPDPEFLREVLDGSIVAMVVAGGDGAEEGRIVHRTAEDLPYLTSSSSTDSDCQPLSPKTSSCIGLALTRAIDTKRKEFQLITPLPESQVAGIMDKKVILVRGSFDAPEWAYLEDLYLNGDRGAVNRPWFSLLEPKVGVEGAVWRLRHPPLSAPGGR